MFIENSYPLETAHSDTSEKNVPDTVFLNWESHMQSIYPKYTKMPIYML